METFKLTRTNESETINGSNHNEFTISQTSTEGINCC